MSSLQSSFTPLVKANYASLTTFRKNGAAVATPMWFAESDGVLYMYTGATSGKVKRIRRTDHVTVTPCTGGGKLTGETIEAHARIVSDAGEIARAEAALAKKYGIQRRALYFLRGIINSVRQRAEGSAYVAIEA